MSTPTKPLRPASVSAVASIAVMRPSASVVISELLIVRASVSCSSAR
jgi:hypothetical protein